MDGGMPGGHRRRPPQREEKPEIKDEYYKVLGCEKSATDKHIRKCYRKMALKHAPDRGGDPEQFKKINEAYEVLKDQKKRKLYDSYGKKGLEAGGDPSGPDDLMSAFFGGGGRRRRSSGPPSAKKGKPMVHALACSLEDLYKGKQFRLKITRTIITRKGESKPVDLHEVESTFDICRECRGNGAVMVTRQIGPGFLQQMQVPCSACSGSGASLCDGFETKKKKELLVVDIPKGSRNGRKIKKEGKGNMVPGTLPGDVIFVVKEKPHSVFTRRGTDLLCEKNITLLEALCGLKWRMKHLDGREIVIGTEPGEVLAGHEVMIQSPSGGRTTYNDLKCVADMGMPVVDTVEFGRLFVAIKVTYPKRGELSKDQLAAIETVLGGREKAPDAKDDEEIGYLEDVDLSSFGKTDEHARGALDESDDEDGIGGGPQRLVSKSSRYLHRSRANLQNMPTSSFSTVEVESKFCLFYEYVSDVLEKRGEFREEHIQVAKSFMENGSLVMGGAYAEPVDGALVVFKNRDAAESFVSKDPYVQNGLVSSHVIREWTTIKA
eukprot:g1581.t1